MRFAFLLILPWIAVVNCLGADWYVAQTATGSGSGADASDCQSVTWLNTYGTWGANAGQIKPGDTVHLVGVITNQIVPNGNKGGLPNSPITIYFEPNAQLSAPTLPAGSCFLYLSPYMVVDGGSNGVIQCTANGDGLGNSNAVGGIYMTGCTNITIRNLHFNNLYVKTNGNADGPVSGGNNLAGAGAIFENGLRGSNYIYNCSFSNICWCVVLFDNYDQFECISNCTFVNYDHAIVPGASNIVIADCSFGSTACWDTYNDWWHHDGIHYYDHIVDIANVNCASFVIAGNRFYGDWGTNNTAFIFLQTQPQNVTLYNNLFIEGPTKLADGMIYGGGLSNLYFNNTFVGNGTPNSTAILLGGWGAVINGAGTQIENNLFSSLATYVSVQITNTPAFTFNNNLFANNVTGGNPPFAGPNNSHINTFSQWQSIYGDANSIFTNATVVNSDGTLPVGSPAIGAGANLSAYFTGDLAGNIRPPIGAWDIGAVAASTTNIVLSTTVPSVSLAASPVTITNGQSATLTWLAVNATNVTLSDLGQVPSFGSTNVWPGGTTTFNLTAQGASGTVSTNVTVTVIGAPAPPTDLHVQ